MLKPQAFVSEGTKGEGRGHKIEHGEITVVRKFMPDF